jgi:ABC-type transport system substrate-binding protein
MRLYAQAEHILMDEAPLVPLTYGAGWLLLKPWVTNMPLSGNPQSFWKDLIIEPH